MGHTTCANPDETICPPMGPDIPSMARDLFPIFLSSVLEHIVDQSNKHAAECMGEQFQT